ncbi:MAG: thioredoxin fold domain-containing protein [Candidatus Omnitrophota bacterium]
MGNVRVIVAAILAIAVCAAAARADTIHLKNGNKVEGIILESRGGDLMVKLDMGMVMTFSESEIASIERSDAQETEALEQSWKEKSAEIRKTPAPKRAVRVEASPPEEEAPSKISWVDNYDKGMSRAKKTNKPAMVDFYTGWCGWCKKLDNETYKDKEVLSLTSKFVCIKVDGDKNKDLTKRFNVRGYPTVLFLSPGGKEIGRLPGFLPAEPFAQKMKKLLQNI